MPKFLKSMLNDALSAGIGVRNYHAEGLSGRGHRGKGFHFSLLHPELRAHEAATLRWPLTTKSK